MVVPKPGPRKNVEESPIDRTPKRAKTSPGNNKASREGKCEVSQLQDSASSRQLNENVSVVKIDFSQPRPKFLFGASESPSNNGMERSQMSAGKALGMNAETNSRGAARKQEENAKAKSPGHSFRPSTPGTDNDDEVVKVCSISSRDLSPIPNGLESQTLNQTPPSTPNNNKNNNDDGGKMSTKSTSSSKRSILPRFNRKGMFSFLNSTLNRAVIISAIVSIITRLLTTFFGKMAFVFYILHSPILWVIRCYIGILHLVIFLVELDWEAPWSLHQWFIPKGTLHNFKHRGFIQSFVGLLDMMMSANISVIQSVEEIHEAGGRGMRIVRRIKISFAILKVASTSLVVCGVIYLLLGLFGWNETSRKEFLRTNTDEVKGRPQGSVGLSKNRPPSANSTPK